ncbi:hypothetical protein A7U60_g1822 [Sanghuangporus baumii]|uniref:DUF6533 domain-containing protein n=1 Tax=Sanghuangporus baumii TaxID=108892 RepID=A0A9Q5I3A1_SANBA|nr:hypothetical protein A7U60_g1822 [Sanghuangporus baumii]
MPPPDESFAFRYTVPTAADEIEAWSSATVIFTNDVRPMREAYRLLNDVHLWLSSADHYVAELHVSRVRVVRISGWNFVAPFFFDARAGFSMMDLYFKYLTAELEGKAKPLESIEWGTEISRLQSPASFVVSLVETGHPPNLPPAPSMIAAEQQGKSEKPAVRLWIYPPTNAGVKRNISRDVTFSQETTGKLHAIAKRHGYTITQLYKYRTWGFHELSRSFNDATHYLIAWTIINHRHKLPGEYSSYESQKGSPLLAQDGTSPVLPMDVIRAMFKIDETKNSIVRVIDENAFWDNLVAAVASMRKSTDVSASRFLEIPSNSFVLYSCSELELVWKARWSAGNVLFVLNRYPVFFISVFLLVYMFDYDSPYHVSSLILGKLTNMFASGSCVISNYVEAWSMLVFIIPVQGEELRSNSAPFILTSSSDTHSAYTSAVGPKPKNLRFALFCAFVENRPIVKPILGCYGILNEVSTSRTIPSWIALIVFDTVVFVLTLIRVDNIRRAKKDRSLLLNILFRDGIIFYVIMLGINQHCRGSSVLPMDVIRAMFKIDEAKNSIVRVIDENAFWDNPVAAVASMLKSIDQSLDAHRARDMEAHVTSQTFNPAVFQIPAFIISSIGDLGRLGILMDYLPGTPSEQTTLSVDDIATGLRCTIAPIVELLCQHNGRLSCHFGTSAENTSEQSLQLETDLLERWVDALSRSFRPYLVVLRL